MRSVPILLAAGFLSLYAHAASSEVVVIVSTTSPITALSAEQVADIFLGKTSVFPGGGTAVPIDQFEGSPLRQEFYAKTTGKSMQLLKAHWSKMIFTGRGEPPREVGDSTEIKKLVAGNPRFVGYVDRSDVDASVRIILAIK